jgi:hypothetical protein
MKNIFFTSIFWIMILLSYSAFSQKEKLKCNTSRYSDEHSDNSQWNALIDNACKEINSGNYQKGYNLLIEANEMDSIATNGFPSVFIGLEIERVRNYLNNAGQETGLVESEPGKEQEVKPEEVLPDLKQPEITLEIATENNTENSDTSAVSAKNVVNTAQDNKDSVKQQDSTNTSETFNNDKIKAQIQDSVVETVPPHQTPANVPEPVNEKPNIEPEPVKEEPASNKNTIDNKSAKVFTEDELADFLNAGKQKLILLEGYLKEISDKLTPASLALQSIENAIVLFDTTARTVQVSSLNSSEKPKYKIRKYLDRLRMLTYENVSIEWAEFEYTSEFRMGFDGNYHGYITFRQRFSAMKDFVPVYSDETTKKIEVILKRYEKAEEGVATEKWDVFLGDMSVIHTVRK